LDSARIAIQIDIGFGDAVTPAAVEMRYPTLLNDIPAPLLRVYPRETVFAEKLEAIVKLGMINSRMKDYFDLLTLVNEDAMDAVQLAKAIDATFARRETPLPASLPIGLSIGFSNDNSKQVQWRAFLRKNKLEAPMLQEVVTVLADFARIAFEGAMKNRAGE